MPYAIRRRNDEWCIYKADANGDPTGDSLGCHATEAQAEAQRRALHASEERATEISGAFRDVTAIAELRGSYPNVPIAADVDYAALITGDDDPMFLTLPIGKANVTSGNGRYYDEAWLMELERQTLANRPVGLMGHLSPEARATEFPPEAIHWVGAVREANMLWGKGYVPPGAVRDRIRRYKAQGKALATSIDANAEGIWDETLSAYRMDARTLRLNQIDIAPADRAGIPDLAATPILTREYAPEPPREPEQKPEPAQDTREESTMDKLAVINEMTADDARLLPQAVREAVLATAPTPETPAEVEQMQTIRETLNLADDADVVAVVTELREARDARERETVVERIRELATSGDKAIQHEAVRGLVIELVQARNPQTVEDAERIYAHVVETDAVKAALATSVQADAGPPQRPAVPPQNARPKYFVIPE